MNRKTFYGPTLVLGTNVETGEPLLLYGDGLCRHKVVYGLSGMGKSKLISSMPVQLLNQGLPFAIIDPHSDLGDDILSILHQTGFFQHPKAYDRLWYIRFAQPDRAVAFNWLKQPFPPQQVAANFLECCKRVWGSLDEGTSVTFENMILAATTVLCENNRPLTDLARLLSDPLYREHLLEGVSDPVVLEFFHTRFDHYGKMALESTLRRLFLLTFSPQLRHALGAADNTINFSQIIDNKISVIFDLGGLDEQTQRFLGVLLTVGFEMAMLARASQPVAKRTSYFLGIDEWAQFLSQSPESLSRMLDLTRKFGLSLTLASQTMSQTRDIRASLQNCLQIAFRLGHDDAHLAASRFVAPIPPQEPTLLEETLISLLGGRPSLLYQPEEPLKASDWEERLKHLPKGHALVHLGGKTIQIQTLFVPQPVHERELASIKAIYARRLLRPIPQHETTSRREAGEDKSARVVDITKRKPLAANKEQTVPTPQKQQPSRRRTPITNDQPHTSSQ